MTWLGLGFIDRIGCESNNGDPEHHGIAKSLVAEFYVSLDTKGAPPIAGVGRRTEDVPTAEADEVFIKVVFPPVRS